VSISFGVPVFNGADYLPECLASLLAQDHDDFEVVISDNASTDETASICRDAAATDPRIRYHRMDENRGAARNYNRVFEMSRGRFFSWTAHDDQRAPTYASRCLEGFAESDPSTVVVYPRAEFLDEQGALIGPDTDSMATSRPTATGRLRDTLWHVNMANAVFGLIRADALRRTRLIDSFVASDYVLLAELAMLGPIVEIPEVLFRRRLHERSSREASRSLRDVQRWFDPSKPGPVISTRQRLLIEYARSARRLSPTAGERLGAIASIPQVMVTRRARIVGGAWKQRLLGTQTWEASDWRNARPAPDQVKSTTE
jgi:glycosyltransferase involved in cell wall biosynthesis